MVISPMKTQLLGLILVFFTCVLPPRAFALLPQTHSDLAVLLDTLKNRLDSDEWLRRNALPTLLATPLHYWKESSGDFEASALNTLKMAFKEPTDIIQCVECDAWRLNIKDNQSLVINNGELSLAELGAIKQNPRYGKAKSLTTIMETPAGVEIRIISLLDGRILLHALANGNESLDNVRPYGNYAAEKERRLRGESLAYVFFNLGLWPQGRFQTEFLEQWGDRNQHISGLGLSLYNPTFALGFVYHYMFPRTRRLHVSGSIYYPLQNMVSSQEKAVDQVVALAMLQYSFANSYGVFGSVDTKGMVSLGFNFYNPLFLPFVL